MVKVVFILVDGIGDVSYRHLNHQTPLQYANTPALDMLARLGVNGLMDPVEPHLACGSDTAHLAIFGYDPRVWYRGRGAFESIGAGLDMRPGDIAFKSNFAIVRPREDGVMDVVSRRASRHFEDIGPALCQYLSDEIGAVMPEEFCAYEITFKYATEHRCGVRIRGPQLSDRIGGTDPLKDGLELRKCMPIKGYEYDEDALRTSALINSISEQVHILLSRHPVNTIRKEQGKMPVNCVLFRGCGMRLDCPSFREIHPEMFTNNPDEFAFGIAPTCIISGLLQTIGIRVLPRTYMNLGRATGSVDSDLQAKAESCINFINENRELVKFAFVHVKGVDDAGHDRMMDVKIELLERVDKMLKSIFEGLKPSSEKGGEEGILFVVTGDHSTPAVTGDHSYEPVPVVICSPYNQFKLADNVECFSEIDASKGALGRFRALDLMEIVKHILHNKQ